MFDKIKAIFSWAKQTGVKIGNAARKLANNEAAADGIMRWPRPVAFFMLVTMFIVGWFNPTTLMAFAQAIAVLPESFWTVVFIVLGSIGATKLSNDIIKVITSRK